MLISIQSKKYEDMLLDIIDKENEQKILSKIYVPKNSTINLNDLCLKGFCKLEFKFYQENEVKKNPILILLLPLTIIIYYILFVLTF